MSTRRRLGPGPAIAPPAARDPRARTAAERAADGDWVELPDDPAPARVPPGGRRTLGPGPATGT
ncbi:hypothetical protein AB0E27_42865 [Streptomyces sparsogenes]|uniref:hypothetical protein n=1 Tax=Streptomyces sparsogenes TaxID=67365 RepID=UPI0033D9F6DB